MREITKYVAEDGREFKFKQDCIDHESAVHMCRKLKSVRYANGKQMEGAIVYDVCLAIGKAGFDIVERPPEAA